MSFNSNFDRQFRIVGDAVEVTGTTNLTPNTRLISRMVALQQGNNVAQGPADNGLLGWAADPPLAAEGFQPGPVTAIGMETLVSDDPPSAMATFTWTQVVDLVEQ
jgi:hypothetical protein